MYHVSAQGVDEHMINVHYYYYMNDWIKQPVGQVINQSVTNPVITLINLATTKPYN